MSEFRFKIVRRSLSEPGEVFESWLAAPPAAVTYRPGEWTTAPFGGLLVWSKWQEEPVDCSKQVWKVEVEEQVPLPTFRLRFSATANPYEEYNLGRRLWEGEKLDSYYLESWPDNTEAWRRVKLVERLE